MTTKSVLSSCTYSRKSSVMTNLETKLSLETPKPGSSKRRGMVSLRLREDAPQLSQRKPVALSICVDASGSMHSILPTIKTILVEFGKICPAGIKLTLSSFSDESSVLCPVEKQNDRNFFVEAARSIKTQSQTNLSGGLTTALQNISLPDSTILLITDGKANVGITDHGKILEAVRQTFLSVRICTLAIGNICDELLLTDLVEATGGSFYHVKTLNDTPKLMGQLLGSLLRPQIHDVRVTLEQKKIRSFEWCQPPILPNLTTNVWVHIPFQVDRADCEVVIPEFCIRYKMRRGATDTMQRTLGCLYHTTGSVREMAMISLQFYRLKITSLFRQSSGEPNRCHRVVVRKRLTDLCTEIKSVIRAQSSPELERFASYLIRMCKRFANHLNGLSFEYNSRILLELQRQQSQGGPGSYYMAEDAKHCPILRAISAPTPTPAPTLNGLSVPKLTRQTTQHQARVRT